MKNLVAINRDLAYKCATALVEQHNVLAGMGHDPCTIISFRSLFKCLCELGMQYMISSAIRPENPQNLPLFPEGITKSK